MTGRPTKLDDTRAARIVELVRAGCTVANAAEAGNIDEGTFYRWMQRGAEHRAPAAFRRFREDVLRARAEAEAEAVVQVRRGARGGAVVERRTIEHKDGRTETIERLQPPDWKADAWFLERSRPKSWGRRTLVEVSGVDGGDIPVAVTTTARDALGDALDLIARRVQAARQVGDEHAARALDVDSVEKAGDALPDHRPETSPSDELAQILTERGT
jgi:hypothetical protein